MHTPQETASAGSSCIPRDFLIQYTAVGPPKPHRHLVPSLWKEPQHQQAILLGQHAEPKGGVTFTVPPRPGQSNSCQALGHISFPKRDVKVMSCLKVPKELLSKGLL